MKPKLTNLSYMNEVAEGSSEFMIELIEIFLHQSPQTISSMKNCVVQEKWDELSGIAHKFKVGLEVMGIYSLSETIKQVETQAKEKKELSVLPLYINTIQEICFNASLELSEELNKLKHNK